MGGQIAVAAGFRDIGNTTTMGYIPSLYPKQLRRNFYAASVLASISNTDFESDVKKFGDQLIIRTTPTITIRNGSKGQTPVFEQPTSAPITMNIDKYKYWAFVTDSLDDVQTDIKDYKTKWTEDAANQMKIAIDTDVLGGVITSAHASNMGAAAGAKSGNINLGAVAGTGLSLTSTNIISNIVKFGQVLDEQDVPSEGRFLVLPPWCFALIQSSDIKNASITGDSQSILRGNGRVGMIARFEVYMSNLLTTAADTASATCTYIMFGTKEGISFAAQVDENDVMKNPNGWGFLHKGRMVYGYKVVQTKCLGIGVVKEGA
jgi:hypothetical protein